MFYTKQGQPIAQVPHVACAASLYASLGKEQAAQQQMKQEA